MSSSAGQGANSSLPDRLSQLERAITSLVSRAEGKRSPSQEPLLPATPSSNATSGGSSVNSNALGAPASQEPAKQHFDTIRDVPSRPPYGQFHFAGHYIGYFSCDGGLPFFTEQGLKWILSRTGGASSCTRLAQLGAEHRRPFQTMTYDLPVIDGQGYFNLANALPKRSATEKLLHDFKGSIFGLVFPVIDEHLFMNTVDLAYQPNDGQITTERITSTACVLAFLSVAFLFQSESADEVHIDTALCAAIARRFLPGLEKKTSITGLQTVLLLVRPLPLIDWFEAATNKVLLLCHFPALPSDSLRQHESSFQVAYSCMSNDTFNGRTRQPSHEADNRSPFS